MTLLQQLHFYAPRGTSEILSANSTTSKITIGTLENMRALTGADILQKHSINSILEGRQDFLARHNDMTNETIVSPISDPIVETNLFGLRKSQQNSVMFFSNDNNGITNADCYTLNNQSMHTMQPLSNYTPLTPTNSTQCSISPGTLSANSYDVFQFENIAQNQIIIPQQQLQQQQPPTPPTQQPLKVGFQRNISFDCSAPLSPSTPTSLYNRSFSSPLVSDSSTSSSANGLSLDSIPLVYQNNYGNGVYSGLKNNVSGGGGIPSSSRSNSPESENSNNSTSETQNLIDMMNLLTVKNETQLQQKLEQNQLYFQQQQKLLQQQQQQHLMQQQQYNHNQVPMPNLKFPYSPSLHLPTQNAFPPNATTATAKQTTINNLFDEQNLQNFEALTVVDFDLTKYQNLQALNALKLLQAQSPQMPLINQLFQGYNQFKNIQPSVAAINDAHLDRVAKFYRSSAALCDATCTWSGQLPMRSHRMYNYSPKVFLGGIPWDISEQSLIQIFKPFGQIKVEWPGKEQQTAQPKGFAYIIFESDKQVKALLSACVLQVDDSHSGCIYYYKISSRRIKAKDVEVIPWFIADANHVKSTSQKLDPTKTVFVGALHGKLTAEGLAKIMDDLFDGVLYAGIDTDKYKYPIGSGRVTFNNNRSYMKAVTAAFIEIRTSKFTKKVQVDPYLEDSLCSICGVQHGPYYCRELSCFRYFCRACWQWQHTPDTVKHHKPLTRNSKSQTLVGIGPGLSTSTWNIAGTVTSSHQQLQQKQRRTSFPPQLQQTQQVLEDESSMYSLEEWLEARQNQQQQHQQQQQHLQ